MPNTAVGAHAIERFEHAIALEPGFARACAGLAACHGLRRWYGIAPPEEGCAKAKKLALQAIEMDPSAVEPHASVAWAAQNGDYDFANAEREFRRAIELDPRYITAHYWFSVSLCWMGRFEEAITEAEYAIHLDPLSAAANPFLDMAYLCSRQYELAAAHSRRTIELHPNCPVSHWALAWAPLKLSTF